MKVKFLEEVVTPSDKAGKVGKTKNFNEKTAKWLIDNGYAESVEKANDENK